MEKNPSLISEKIPITEQPLRLNSIADLPVPVIGGDIRLALDSYPIYPKGVTPVEHAFVKPKKEQPHHATVIYGQSGYEDNPPPPYSLQPIQQQPPPGYFIDFRHDEHPPGFRKFATTVLRFLNPNATTKTGKIVIEPPEKPPVMPKGTKDGIPPGLELLAELDTIILKKDAEMLPVMAGYEDAHRFNIINNRGERIYFGGEDTEMSTLSCSGPHRPFHITIIDFSGRAVLTLERPFDKVLYTTNCWVCCCCWCGIIGGSISVKLADGMLLGEITHKYAFYRPQYEIRDADGNLVMNIEGNQCGDCFICQTREDQCHESVFSITAMDGESIGSIKRRWGDFKEFFTDADTVGAEFIEELDINTKALILGAVFLLDFMYYEQPEHLGEPPEFN